MLQNDRNTKQWEVNVISQIRLPLVLKGSHIVYGCHSIKGCFDTEESYFDINIMLI